MKTLQIATAGEDVERTISGIKNFPAQKLVLVAYAKHEEVCTKLKLDLGRALNLEIDIRLVVNEDAPHEEMFSIIDDALKRNKDFDDVMINVGGGDKFLTCAAVASAFLNGLKAFHCKDDSNCTMLPVLKLGYTKLISETKIKILQAIDNGGGEVVNLNKLSKKSGYGVPLLSYHVHTGPGNLAEFGLVEVHRGKRGSVEVKITTLGRLIAQKRFLQNLVIK